RMRRLLSFAAGDRAPALTAFLQARAPEIELPSGCSVDVELEARDLLRALLPKVEDNEAVRVYREIRADRGERPIAGELYGLGFNPGSIKSTGGWLGFVRDEGD